MSSGICTSGLWFLGAQSHLTIHLYQLKGKFLEGVQLLAHMKPTEFSTLLLTLVGLLSVSVNDGDA